VGRNVGPMAFGEVSPSDGYRTSYFPDEGEPPRRLGRVEDGSGSDRQDSVALQRVVFDLETGQGLTNGLPSASHCQQSVRQPGVRDVSQSNMEYRAACCDGSHVVVAEPESLDCHCDSHD
jgi:hypothetical protein